MQKKGFKKSWNQLTIVVDLCDSGLKAQILGVGISLKLELWDGLKSSHVIDVLRNVEIVWEISNGGVPCSVSVKNEIVRT